MMTVKSAAQSVLARAGTYRGFIYHQAETRYRTKARLTDNSPGRIGRPRLRPVPAGFVEAGAIVQDGGRFFGQAVHKSYPAALAAGVSPESSVCAETRRVLAPSQWSLTTLRMKVRSCLDNVESTTQAHRLTEHSQIPANGRTGGAR